jgi:hypothetical protein
MEKVGIFYGHLEHITTILCPSCDLVALWYIFPILVYCALKNLATL